MLETRDAAATETARPNGMEGSDMLTSHADAFRALSHLRDGDQAVLRGSTGSRWIVRRISAERLRVFASAGFGATQMWVVDLPDAWEVCDWVGLGFDG